MKHVKMDMTENVNNKLKKDWKRPILKVQDLSKTFGGPANSLPEDSSFSPGTLS